MVEIIYLNLKVFCTDCDRLLQTVLEERGVQPADADVHCGFDGGQGILKITITATQKKEVVTKKGRSTYDQVILHSHILLCCNNNSRV